MADENDELLNLLRKVDGPEGGGSAELELLEEPEQSSQETKSAKSEIVKDGTTKTMMVDDEETPGQVFAKEILSKYSDLYGKLIERSEADETEIQDVLNFLKDKVFTDQEVETPYIVALSQTIQTKTSATTNTVKLLDNMVKLISAGKGSSMFGEQKSSATADMVKLATILQQDKYDDEHG